MPNKPLEHYLEGEYQFEVIPEETETETNFLVGLPDRSILSGVLRKA